MESISSFVFCWICADTGSLFLSFATVSSPACASCNERKCSSEAHPVSVAVGISALVIVAVGIRVADLAQDDYTGRASIDAQCTAGANVVVDGKDDIVRRIEPGLFGSDRFVDGRGSYGCTSTDRYRHSLRT